MKRIQQQTLDQERALYGMKDIEVVDCAFDGPADGESALKEGAGIKVERCYFNLRYPFWHDHGLVIRDSRMTELCRAALWYSDHIEITHTALHGIKALRECSEVTLRDCDIISPEFGWSVHGITMEHCTAQSGVFHDAFHRPAFYRCNLQGKIFFSSTSKTRPLTTAASIPRTRSGMPGTWWCETAWSRESIWRGTART